jgi:hypothetical protein
MSGIRGGTARALNSRRRSQGLQAFAVLLACLGFYSLVTNVNPGRLQHFQVTLLLMLALLLVKTTVKQIMSRLTLQQMSRLTFQQTLPSSQSKLTSTKPDLNAPLKKRDRVWQLIPCNQVNFMNM